MTIYTATPEMCHPRQNYSGDLLPHDWVGKKFRLNDNGDAASLVDATWSTISAWPITQDLAAKIKASAAPEEAKPDITQELRDELQRMRDVVAAKERELSTFKKRVGEVAMEYAERHDWCETVREALDEIGVEVPTKEYAFTLSVIYHVRGTKETYGEPDTYYINRYIDLDPDVTVTMDDWGDLEVEYVQHDVMDVEEVRE